jgi:hypothetical protein
MATHNRGAQGTTTNTNTTNTTIKDSSMKTTKLRRKSARPYSANYPISYDNYWGRYRAPVEAMKVMDKILDEAWQRNGLNSGETLLLMIGDWGNRSERVWNQAFEFWCYRGHLAKALAREGNPELGQKFKQAVEDVYHRIEAEYQAERAALAARWEKEKQERAAREVAA